MVKYLTSSQQSIALKALQVSMVYSAILYNTIQYNTQISGILVSSSRTYRIRAAAPDVMDVISAFTLPNVCVDVILYYTQLYILLLSIQLISAPGNLL